MRLTSTRGRARNGNSWYRLVRNTAPTIPAALHIYDEIGMYGVTASDLVAELADMDARSIDLHLNSPGGEVFDGIAIYNALRSHAAQVTTYVDSLAASIASVIAMAGDRIVMQPHSQLMIHDGAGLCVGNAADMREMADLLDRQSDNIAGVYAARAGGQTRTWRARMRDETWYTAQEAVDAGLADEVVDARRHRGRPEPDGDEPEPEPASMRAGFDLSVFRYPGRDAAPDPTIEPVSPVTRVVDTASAVHHTATTDASWDGPAAEAAMPNEAAALRYCHAWRNTDGDPNAKGTYKFPHHTKQGGPANLAACRNGLARLSGADIPDSDRAGVEAHLRAHLADGGSDEGGDTTNLVDEATGLTEADLGAYEPDVFKAALADAADTFRFDPDGFKASLAFHAGDAPAVLPPVAEMVPYERDPAPEQPTEPEPDDFTTAMDIFTTAIKHHTNHAPAVPASAEDVPEQDPYDATTVTRAIREAIR